jgi:2-(1,2-epoxy-1,2-dihydrophenyl)acetyl-CoA isomerase
MTDTASPAVRFERHGSTALVTLDNAASRNALIAPVKDGLLEALARVKADPAIRAVVLAGANGAFCAGGDLRAIQAAAQLDGEAKRAAMQDTHVLFRELLTLDRPVIAAVDGAAYGAGFSLALTADFVLVSPRARFCMVFMRIGVMPDCGATYTLPRVVGAQRARELFLSAREVDANEALALGIAMEQHASAALLPRALALAASFGTAAPLAVGLVKRSTLDVGAMEAAFETEATGQALCLQSAAHRDAVQRFFDKQAPAFQWPAKPQP